MAKEHFEFEDITTEETNEIKDLYIKSENVFNGLTPKEVLELCHKTGYELEWGDKEADGFDVIAIFNPTEHTKPFELQGIRVYYIKDTKTLSRFIDVFFNDEEYPFEDYEVKEA